MLRTEYNDGRTDNYAALVEVEVVRTMYLLLIFRQENCYTIKILILHYSKSVHGSDFSGKDQRKPIQQPWRDLEGRCSRILNFGRV